MQIVSSYGVEIKKKNIPLRSTLDIFRKAVSYLIPVYAETWEELSEIRNPQKRFNEAEHLVHETKKANTLPSVTLRESLISSVTSIWSSPCTTSYSKRSSNWVNFI